MKSADNRYFGVILLLLLGCPVFCSALLCQNWILRCSLLATWRQRSGRSLWNLDLILVLNWVWLAVHYLVVSDVVILLLQVIWNWIQSATNLILIYRLIDLIWSVKDFRAVITEIWCLLIGLANSLQIVIYRCCLWVHLITAVFCLLSNLFIRW